MFEALICVFVLFQMSARAYAQELRANTADQNSSGSGTPTVQIGALVWENNLCVRVTPPGQKPIVIPFSVAVSSAGCAGHDRRMRDYSAVRKAYGLPKDVYVRAGRFSAVVWAITGQQPTWKDMNNIAGKFNQNLTINKGTEASISGTRIAGSYDNSVTPAQIRADLESAIQGTRFRVKIVVIPSRPHALPVMDSSTKKRDEQIVNSLKPHGPPGYLLRPKDPNSPFCKKFPGTRGC